MGHLPDTYNCELRIRWECQERFPRHRLQGKPLFNDPVMHHGTCATDVPWCMSGSLTRDGGENVPGTCATHNFTYLLRDPCILPFSLSVACSLTLSSSSWSSTTLDLSARISSLSARWASLASLDDPKATVRQHHQALITNQRGWQYT